MRHNALFAAAFTALAFFSPQSPAQAQEDAPAAWFQTVLLEGGLTMVAQNTSGNSVDSTKDQADFVFTGDILISAYMDPQRQIFFGLETGDGHSIDDNIGSRAIANYDAYITNMGEMTRLNVSQAYYKSEMAEGALTFAAGKMDSHALTDTNQFANSETTQFLNGLFVRSTGALFQEMPYYYSPTVMLQIKVPFFSFITTYSNPDGFDIGGKRCIVAQAGMHVGEGEFAGNYLFGYLTNRGEFTKTSSGAGTDNSGFFLSLDQGLGGLGLFFRYAQQDKTIAQNEAVSAMSGGLSINGMMGNNGNGMGLAYGKMTLNKEIITGYNEGLEVIELYIRLGTGAKTALTLDLQRLSNLERAEKRQIYVAGIRLQADI